MTSNELRIIARQITSGLEILIKSRLLAKYYSVLRINVKGFIV